MLLLIQGGSLSSQMTVLWGMKFEKKNFNSFIK